MSGVNEKQLKSFFSEKTGDDANNIDSIEHFQCFKEEFLQTFRDHLDPVGTATAREADEELYDELEVLARACLHTKNLVKEGKITPDSSTVTGQKSINELVTHLKKCETSIENYFPKSKFIEKKVGYTKFELAAVLIRDGFRVYGLMTASKDYLAGLVTEGGALSEVLKPNQLTIMMYYFNCLESFFEQLSDLGMYQLAEQCIEVYKIRPRGKKKKGKKFSRGTAMKDALDDTTDEEGGRNKSSSLSSSSLEPPPDPHAPLFENKTKEGGKTRAIMDKGWSNGFAPGEEIKAPESAKMPKKKKKKKTRSKSSLDTASTDGGTTSDDLDGEDSHHDDDDPASGNRKTKKSSSSNPRNAEEEKDGTDTTDDDEGESSSSEEEDEEDEDDYIYYFDPIQNVVGKLSRTACLTEGLILKADPTTRKEVYDGIVEEWDTKECNTHNDDNDDESVPPGKTEIIITLKEILRGKARDKVGGLE